MRKILTLTLALALTLACVGCSCSGTVGTSPSPSPKATIGALASASPQQSPDTQQSPGTGDPQQSPGTSPEGGGGLGTGGQGTGGQGTGTGTMIPNFAEGTEVKIEDVPKVKEAIEKKYPGAQITSVKHAMNAGAQAYAVTIKVGTTEKTVYVSPDGSDATENEVSGTGGNGASGSSGGSGGN